MSVIELLKLQLAVVGVLLSFMSYFEKHTYHVQWADLREPPQPGPKTRKTKTGGKIGVFNDLKK